VKMVGMGTEAPAPAQAPVSTPALTTALAAYTSAVNELAYLESTMLEQETALWQTLFSPTTTIAAVEREVRIQLTDLRSEQVQLKAQVEIAKATLEVEKLLVARG